MGNDRPTLYTGVTNNLIRRTWEHKNGKGSKFTKKYKLHKLLYYEFIENIEDSILREKQIKNMSRDEKISLIKKKNPILMDISKELFDYIDCDPSEIFSDIKYDE